MPDTRRDLHSYSHPEKVRTATLDLELDVLFDQRVIQGVATHRIERMPNAAGAPLVLDTRGLTIHSVETAPASGAFQPAKFTLGPSDAILGAPLSIELPPDAVLVRVRYTTGPNATALQWLEPRQTAGGKHPFLFTQSQAIHARSWIPLQDSPGVRVTYTATVRTPKGLRAVMANSDPAAEASGEYRFALSRPIPAYLFALAAGDLAFRPVGKRCGVYAEPSVVERAAKEFEDTEKMLEAAERLYGEYRWGRYDVLVLPPSFPFGGMENPTLTFATPTILAGDKSLVSLVAHELAHSWSGNLVTNATWRDFWLNEGFTVYVERRILEEVYGKPRAAMEAVLGRRKLADEVKRLPAPDQILHIDLSGRDPDDGVSDIPYEKGALLLYTLEAAFGRRDFDAFVHAYFERFAFQSITTATFEDYLRRELFPRNAQAAAAIPLDEWINEPGIPESAFVPKSDALDSVEAAAKKWTAGAPASTLVTRGWSTHEWLHFLQSLPRELAVARMKELDQAFHFTNSGNSEILSEWLLAATRNHYGPADRRTEEFLTSQGRRKFLKPLYEDLARTPEGKQRALAIYAKARPTYHPIAVATIDALLK